MRASPLRGMSSTMGDIARPRVSGERRWGKGAGQERHQVNDENFIWNVRAFVYTWLSTSWEFWSV